MYRVIGSVLLVIVIVATFIVANSGSSEPESGEVTAPMQQPVNDQPSKNFNL